MSIESIQYIVISNPIVTKSNKNDDRKSIQYDVFLSKEENKIDKEKESLDKKSNKKFSPKILKEIAKELRSSMQKSRRITLESHKFTRSNSLIFSKKNNQKTSILDNEILSSSCRNLGKNYSRNSLLTVKSKNIEKHEKNFLDITNLFMKTNDSECLLKIGKNKQQEKPSFYSRQSQNKEKEKQKLQLLYFEKHQKEMDKLRDRPEIDEKSKKMLEGKYTEPIYKRTNKVIENKNQKLERLKTEVFETRKKNNPDDYITHITSKYDNDKFNIWIENNKKNQDKIEENLQKIRNGYTNKELKSSFSPVINKNSKKIVDKKKKEEKTYEKLYNDSILKSERLQEKVRNLTPNFTPSINHKYPNYLLVTNKSTDNLMNNKNILIRNEKHSSKVSTNSNDYINPNNNLNNQIVNRPETSTLNKCEIKIIDYDGFSTNSKSKVLNTPHKNQYLKELNPIRGALTDRNNINSFQKINNNDKTALYVNKEYNVVNCQSIKNYNFVNGFINRKDKFETIN